MTVPDHARLVRELLDPPLADLGFKRKKMMWRRQTDETVFLLDAQKSQYSARYYVNVGLVFSAVSSKDWPTQPYWNVQTRAEGLLDEETASKTLEWLNLENSLSDEDRRTQAQSLVTALSPYVDAAESLDSLTNSAYGELLLSASLVDGDASALIKKAER